MSEASPVPGWASDDAWPELQLGAWQETCTTLHLWTQMVGKIRLAQSTWVNHSWHVPLYVTARGLTTSPISYGERVFQLDFDFCEHCLRITTAEGAECDIGLYPRSVADLYAELFARLSELGLEIRIHTKPNEVMDPIPFEYDDEHASYDAEAVHRFWRALVQAHRVLKEFRARFIGKCSPVHFFWGSFDLAVTRFSGREAPPHPGGIPNLPDWVAREAYSHEVSSCGFWPGGDPVGEPVFYSYAYPEPEGFSRAAVAPGEAYYSSDLGEFLLPYDAVRRSPAPDEMLLEFLQSTYEVAAELGGWDRAALERKTPFWS